MAGPAPVTRADRASRTLIRLAVGAATETGPVRLKNEDAFVVATLDGEGTSRSSAFAGTLESRRGLVLRQGDVLLLCSDGLSGLVEASEIERIVAEHDDPDQAAHALVDAAVRAGGHDNITVIVARPEGEWLEPARADDVLVDRSVATFPPDPVSWRDRSP